MSDDIDQIERQQRLIEAHQQQIKDAAEQLRFAKDEIERLKAERDQALLPSRDCLHFNACPQLKEALARADAAEKEADKRYVQYSEMEARAEAAEKERDELRRGLQLYLTGDE